jgi:hypothetical protein
MTTQTQSGAAAGLSSWLGFQLDEALFKLFFFQESSSFVSNHLNELIKITFMFHVSSEKQWRPQAPLFNS